MAAETNPSLHPAVIDLSPPLVDLCRSGAKIGSSRLHARDTRWHHQRRYTKSSPMSAQCDTSWDSPSGLSTLLRGTGKDGTDSSSLSRGPKQRMGLIRLPCRGARHRRGIYWPRMVARARHRRGIYWPRMVALLGGGTPTKTLFGTRVLVGINRDNPLMAPS
jgi:hypothetical protein